MPNDPSPGGNLYPITYPRPHTLPTQQAKQDHEKSKLSKEKSKSIPNSGSMRRITSPSTYLISSLAIEGSFILFIRSGISESTALPRKAVLYLLQFSTSAMNSQAHAYLRTRVCHQRKRQRNGIVTKKKKKKRKKKEKKTQKQARR